MTRTPNFIYQSPVEAIGASLDKALFGDPEAAAKQQQARTEAELTAARTKQALAAAGYDDSRTTGQNGMNGSAASLPGLIAGLFAPRDTPDPTTLGEAKAGLGMNVPAMPGDGAPAPRANLHGTDMASVIAALAGQQGDKVDMGETIGALGAMLGDDEGARRGLIAQGQTPGKDFALTADRADQVAAIENASELAKAIGVASINNRDDVPVANIQATTQRRGQDVGSTDRRRGQDISAAARREAAAMREAARNSSVSARPISAAAYRMLFGVADDPEELGELGNQLADRGWDQTPDGGTLTQVRAAVVNRYRQTGNHVQAVREVLDELKRRWDAKQAGG